MSRPLSAAELAALRTFAGRHGHAWKAELLHAWRDARRDLAPLDALRHSHGPAWLAAYSLTGLDVPTVVCPACGARHAAGYVCTCPDNGCQ